MLQEIKSRRIVIHGHCYGTLYYFSRISTDFSNTFSHLWNQICLTIWLFQTRLPPPSPTPRRSIPTLRSSPFTKQQQRNRAGSLHDSTLLCVPNTMPSSSTTRNGMGKSLLHNKRKSTTDGSAATSSQETFQMLAKNQGDSADFIEIQTIDEVVTQV